MTDSNKNPHIVTLKSKQHTTTLAVSPLAHERGEVLESRCSTNVCDFRVDQATHILFSVSSDLWFFN